ncbi:TPA: hypothetical protein EYG96_03305 [Candidatus Gracilibacteria bacterium]|nr:hypothetical protein [Candidatus Gracilibacteria bacterium]
MQKREIFVVMQILKYLEKVEKNFTSKKLQSSKNRRFECLRDDSNREKDKIIAKVNNDIIEEGTIKNIEFSNYIEPLPETIRIYTKFDLILDIKNNPQ